MTPNGLSIIFSDLISCGWVNSTQGIRTWNEGEGITVVDVGNTGPTSTFTIESENSYEHYVRMFEEGRYSLLLFDGSLVSLTYKMRGAHLVWHRYCYVPPIVNLDINAGETVDLLPTPDEYLFTPRRTLLRFEYDPNNQSEGHPFSHLHLNIADCRMPVSGSLSVKDFLFALVDVFYPSFLAELGPTLAPSQPSVSHLSDEDRKRIFVKVPL